MKLLIKGIISGGLMVVLTVMGACSGKKENKTVQRDYFAELRDSVSLIKSEIDSCKNAMESIDHRRVEWSRDFTTIANDREVAPYSIFNSFADNYPPTTTCVIARLAENGQFELIGALTGSRFDRLSVTAAGETVSTATIAPDQARNYMADGLNTVMFDGPEADNVGHLIADNELDEITVTFLNGGRAVKMWKMPTDYAKMVMATYEYYAQIKELDRLQRRIPMLERKLQILNRHLVRSEIDRSPEGNR